MRWTRRSVFAEAVAQVTPKCSESSAKDAPGLRSKKANVRNWGTDSSVALRSRISARINRMTKGIVSITLAAHCLDNVESRTGVMDSEAGWRTDFFDPMGWLTLS